MTEDSVAKENGRTTTVEAEGRRTIMMP
uniref:Uncharacterized protein n=1 Tax=Arundo donax TaxID=35708 RepID=A0A0A9CBK3_ARUDO